MLGLYAKEGNNTDFWRSNEWLLVNKFASMTISGKIIDVIIIGTKERLLFPFMLCYMYFYTIIYSILVSKDLLYLFLANRYLPIDVVNIIPYDDEDDSRDAIEERREEDDDDDVMNVTVSLL